MRAHKLGLGDWVGCRLPEEANRKIVEWFYPGSPGSRKSLEYPEAKGKFKIYGATSTNEMEARLNLYPEASSGAMTQIRKTSLGGRVGRISNTDMTRVFITRSKFSHISENTLYMETEMRYMTVMVKIWNRRSKCGLAWCLKEILVHKWITANANDLYGPRFLLPPVLAMREYPPEECALAMIKVGHDLYLFNPDALEQANRRKVDGFDEEEGTRWFVNGVMLTRKQVNAIERSATHGLQRLKKVGTIDRNPNPEHLRVTSSRLMARRFGTLGGSGLGM